MSVPALDSRQKKSAVTTALVLIVVIVIVGVYLAIMSGIVRYYDYIKENPVIFGIELLLFSLGIAIPYIIIFRMRGGNMRRLWIDVPLLVVKFIVAWVLFELSGINNMLFPINAT